MQAGQSESSEGAIKVRHILYSPNDDPAAAAQVAEGDAGVDRGRGRGARRVREAQGRSLAVRLDRARGERRGRRGDQRRQAAVLRDRGRDRPGVRRRDLRAGPPARPAPRARQVGVRLARHPGHARPDRPRVGEQAQDATSTAGRLTFADAARDNSDNAEAADGRRHRLGRQGPARPQEQEKAIFAAPIGKVSDPLVVDGDGPVPVPRVGRADPRARRRAEGGPRELRVLDLVLEAEGRLRHHPRPGDLRHRTS